MPHAIIPAIPLKSDSHQASSFDADKANDGDAWEAKCQITYSPRNIMRKLFEQDQLNDDLEMI
jgi:hypothetical protein